jgi:hypothetical protein
LILSVAYIEQRGHIKMLVVINNLKYDTDKMDLVSTKCEYTCVITYLGTRFRYINGKNVKIFKSLKNNWLLTYEALLKENAVALSEEEAKRYLMRYDLKAYEKNFGKLEEA